MPATSRIASSANPISVSSNRIGSIDQIFSQRDVDLLLLGEAARELLRSREHRGELAGVEVPLVEQLLCRLDDGGDDPRPADDAARRAHGAVARLAGDVADRERELRGARERVAALVHRRRAGVGRLPRPRDAPALDAERAEHDAERQVERLEHRALLDVELEVGGGALELGVRVECAVEVDAVGTDRVGSETPSRSIELRNSSWSAIEPAAADEPNSERPNRAPSSSAQSTSRTVTGGVPSSAIRRSTSAPASTLRQPSSQPPFGTESMWPPISTARSESPRSVYQSFPAGRAPRRAAGRPATPRARRAPSPRSPSTRPAARRSRPRSANEAPGAG